MSAEITDRLLLAYVDGELSDADCAAVEAAAAADPTVAARLQLHTELASDVRGAFADIADEPVPTRLLKAVEAGPPSAPRTFGEVIPFRPRAAPARRPPLPLAAAIAASLAIGVLLGRLAWPVPSSPIGPDLTARSSLALALNQALSGEHLGKVSVGLSFRSADGPVCRTFRIESEAQGLACRAGAQWRVRMVLPAAPAAAHTDYQTAASPLAPPLADLAQSLADGPAMDAAAERRARANGWR